tara:strand:- start:2208 stop:3278 length:1071 start_codon:yes stop_codon:yes gene_type:complete
MDFRDFTLFDVFWKNKSIYLILSINYNPIDEKDLDISLNQFNLKKLKRKIVKDEYEPILILIYDDCNVDIDKDLSVKIVYGDIHYSKKIEKVITKGTPGFLSITTLFKGDYRLFPNYYKYYKGQGVEHFFMYYNGLLNDDIKEVFNYEDVTLIEWDFRYWNYLPASPHLPRCPYGSKLGASVWCKYCHHAQVGQINHALHKYGKDNYQYMIFNDLDEYFYIHNIKLSDHIRLNPNFHSFLFKNLWAKALDESLGIQGDLLIDENGPYLPERVVFPDKLVSRGKSLYLLSSVDFIGIHTTNLIEDSKINKNHIFFHICNIGIPHRGQLRPGGGGDRERHPSWAKGVIKLNLDFLNLS